MNFERLIRTIPDYPRAGVMFRDITPVLADGQAFAALIARLSAPFGDARIGKVVGIEARGFIVGGAVAHTLGAGFTPMRKRGKLPWTTLSQAYSLEYGKDALEVHTDALAPGERVLILDDLIATGGTAFAALSLVERLGAIPVAAAFVIDLPALGGAQKLRDAGVRVEALCSF